MTVHPEVDWSVLEHAYGAAEDTPGLIGALRGEGWQAALDNLYASILHQGTVYNATVPAVPLLVDVALDASAPGRLGAIGFLESYGESIWEGASESSHYLPDDTDMDDFDESARAALADAARRLVPLLADEDGDVRAATYRFTMFLAGEPVAAEVVPVLRARFGVEDTTAGSAALVASLIRHGKFRRADFKAVIARGDEAVVFVAAWSSIAEGLELPGALDHVVRLWLTQAGKYAGSGPEESLVILASHAGAGAIPVLHGLVGSVDVEALAEAWVEVALRSRGAGDEVVDGLLQLTPRDASVVSALDQVLPAVPHRAAEICDVVAELADSGDPVVLASVATTLFGCRDPRWAAPARAATLSPIEPTVNRRSNRTAFAYALVGFRAAPDDVNWAADDVFEVVVAALNTWRSAAWIEVLSALPATQDMVRAVVPLAPELPHQVGKLLALAKASNPALDIPPLRAVAERNAWVVTVDALSDPDADLDAAFREAWEAVGADEDLIEAWATRPTPALREACLGQLTGTADTSFPGRFAQLAAARVVGDPEITWPTVLAVLNEGENPLPQAVELALTVPGRRAEVVAVLRDIVANGRQTWSGTDHFSTAAAVDALIDLGEIDAADAGNHLVSALMDAIADYSAGRVAPVVGRALVKLTADQPELREHLRAELAPIVAGDQRIPTAGGTIADDVEIVNAVRAAL
ncbi:hypothetical protein [Actinokineospora globicatena]|uniref:hypothetical protein n=1 Tax=Actinokineospora globicatena TaxID=103729 RepID=UPI0020A2D082|nr:hypothetical protein [Actinokineospora globicatena]MCP2303522.1 hypothetical protein [Actinokineospora globicatena]